MERAEKRGGVTLLDGLRAACDSRFFLAGVLLLGQWEALRWYALRMDDGSDEPWGVLTAAIALALSGWKTRTESVGGARLSIACVLLAAQLALSGILSPLPNAGLGLLALACLLARRDCWVGHLGLFILSLPIISSLQFYLGYPLRLAIGWMCSLVLNFLGLAVEAQGTILLYRGEAIVIDAPCSGVRMLWMALFFACLLCVIQKKDTMRSVRLLQMASLITFLANALRNLVLFFLESGIVVMSANAHEFAGAAIFGLAVFTIYLASRRIETKTTSRASNSPCNLPTLVSPCSS